MALRSLDAAHPGLARARLHTNDAIDPRAIEAAVATSYNGTAYTPIGVVDVDGQTAP